MNAWRPLIHHDEVVVEFEYRTGDDIAVRARDAARMLFAQLADPGSVHEPGARIIMRCEVYLVNQTDLHARAVAAFNAEWAQLVPDWVPPEQRRLAGGTEKVSP